MVVLGDDPGARNVRAAGLMAVNILPYSLSPVVIILAGVSGLPFLFAAVMQVGGMVGYLLLLGSRYRSLLSQGCVRDAVRRHLLDVRRGGPLLVLGAISGLDYALFTYSTRFVDVSVAAVLFELWPLFSVPLMAALTRRKGRYARITLGSMLLLSGGFAGAAFVVASQSGRFGGAGVLPTFDLALGASMAVLSAVAVALAVCLFRWSEDLVERLPGHARDSWGHLDLELFAVAVAIVVADVFSFAMDAGVGLATGENLGLVHMAVGLAFGLFVYFLGSLAWRAANIIAANLGVNALTYFTPILALGWLWVYSASGLPGHQEIFAIARPEFLVIGSAAIVSFNLLIYFRD